VCARVWVCVCVCVCMCGTCVGCWVCVCLSALQTSKCEGVGPFCAVAPPPQSVVGRDSLVGLATCYGDRTPPGGEISLVAQFGLETHPAFRIMRSGSFLAVKRPERGANHVSHCKTSLRMGCRLRL